MSLLRAELIGGVGVIVTTRAAGDARDPAVCTAALERVWSIPHQVHGADVHVLRTPARTTPECDALVSVSGSEVLGVLGADCPLIAIASAEGVVAAVHAGWRGLRAGVIAAAIATLRGLGASELEAVLGPCIYAECYEFSPGDLAALTDVLGQAIVAETSTGRPALDLPAAVRSALERDEVALVATLGGCTACSGEFFSYRARGEEARQVLGVYRR